jgi:sigma-B regulation protein RsbU (phosphoserine phosphatase)
MLAGVLKLFLNEYRTRRMARFTAWLVAYGAAVWLTDRVTRSAGGAPALLWFLFWAGGIVSAVYYGVRLMGFIRERILWRLRRRLVVAYVFVAFVPIVLIVLLVALGAFILGGQLAAFLVALNLRDHFDELEQVNRVVRHEAHRGGPSSPDARLEGIRNFYVAELAKHAASYPGLEVTLSLGTVTRAFRLNGQPSEKPVTVPTWLNREEFAGIVTDNGQIALRSVQRTPTSAGELTLILSQPFTPELLDLAGKGIGPVGVVITEPEQTRAAPRPGFRIKTPEGAYVQAGTINSKSLQLPRPVSRLDFTVFGASSLEPTLWGGEKEQRVPQPIFVYVTSRIMTLSHQLLATLGTYSQIYVYAFEAVAIIFLVIEGVALIIGVRLTRSITGTVDQLYNATERVKAGDFSYRINIPSRDQLSALGGAFDGMTASVERLLRESQEKLRLESELEIAREVQRQLFPQSAPAIRGLRLYGMCKAARSVSGDYYDFFRLSEHRVGLVLGDVSGKGISAALLMAAIQSALRAQFYDGFAPASASDAIPLSTAAAVGRLNVQLYENTPLEKYVTLFFAEYNAQTRKLTYTNAGHLPPVLFRRGGVERLRTGGTVVGLFSSTPYEQAEVQLEPGDLLLAFTDGISEPENAYGEEFGEERVLEVVSRFLHAPPEVLTEEIYRSVNDWTGSPELQDDMTLLLARAVE